MSLSEQLIYLDYNATTPVAKEVADGIVPFVREHFGNPSSSHSLGTFCRQAIEKARAQVAGLINASPEEIFFTSGGTESNNLAIKGTFCGEKRHCNLVTSEFEHPAIKMPALHHQDLGGTVSWIRSGGDGIIRLDSFEDALSSETQLVSVMHANNEIGTIQPIRRLAGLCQDRGILVHTDAAQSLGKIPVDVEVLQVDFLTIAGHKLYAPKGVGALYIRKGTNVEPPIQGAGHERGIRPGTENVPYIVGLGIACEIAAQKLDDGNHFLTGLRNEFESRLSLAIPGLAINGGKSERLPNTSSVRFPDVRAAEILNRCPDLCVSTGAACHADSVELSDTLKSIGLTAAQGAGTVRVSFGRYSTEQEMNVAADWLIAAWRELNEQ